MKRGNNGNEPINPVLSRGYIGLTKREHFAAGFMQAMLTEISNKSNESIDPEIIVKMVKESIVIADVMVEYLDKK